MAAVQLQNIVKHFGKTPVLRGVDLDIADGELLVLVGPSGCGKSTLLRLIAGLDEVSSGRVFIGGVDCTQAQPSQRHVAMVFQSYALYPHMTVQENLGFGMRMRGVPAATIRAKLERAVALLKLQPYLSRRPAELSGGQCQRVAIGRAIVQEPGVFLFDEPLSNLDAELRLHMRLEIAALHRELGATLVYVTHDQVEAMTLAQRIVVLREGRIEQVGTPQQLYHQPVNRFVAGFIGAPAMNLLPCTLLVENQVVYAVLTNNVKIALTLLPAQRLAGACWLGLRPEHLVAAADGPLCMRVQHVEWLGASSMVHGQLDATAVPLCAEVRGAVAQAPGTLLRWKADTKADTQTHAPSLHVFGPDGQRIVPATSPHNSL